MATSRQVVLNAAGFCAAVMVCRDFFFTVNPVIIQAMYKKMKMKELNTLKNDAETLKKKLAELSEGKLEQVSSGIVPPELDTKHHYELSGAPVGKWLSE